MADLLQDLQEKVSDMEDQLTANTRLTMKVAQDTQEIIEIFNGVKAAVKFLSILGRLLKWVAGIAGAAGVLWGIIKYGGTKPLQPFLTGDNTMNWESIFKGVAPWLTTALTSGPVGLAVMAAGQIAKALGLGDATVDGVKDALSNITLSGEQRLALQKEDHDFQAAMKKLGIEELQTLVNADVDIIKAVNATMQAESANSDKENWWQKGWRPFNGYIVGLGSLIGVLYTCYLMDMAIRLKIPEALAAIPNVAIALTTILAVPGAAVGITAWHRGKMQRGE